MKKVLLTTTAVVFTAGFVSAGDMSMSGAIKLTYGAFGTGTDPAGQDAWTSEADLDVAASSASGSISMSGTLELDEDGNPATGPVTISMGTFSLTYDANDIGALALAPAGGDGEDDNYGDYSVSYSAGPLSATYVGDHETDDSSMAVSYAAGALTLGITQLDERAGAGGATGIEKTTVSASYTTGPYTISLSGDDQADQDWDASVAMVSGDTTVTVAADETEMMSVGIAYAAGDMTVTARQEFNNAAGTDDETEIGVTYTSGAVTFGAAYDSGQGGANNAHYGDEAELVLNASYTDGDVTVAAKGNDKDEMEVSVSFAF